MIPREELLTHSDYLKVLKGHLPPSAFIAAPHKLWIILAHIVVVIGAIIFIGYTDMPLQLMSSLIIGHSLTCIVFLTHELSHNAIVRNRAIRYILEVFLWGLNLIPATMWRRLHNQSHHIYASTIKDPDRFFIKSELESSKSLLRRIYTRLFFPHRFTPKWNPLVGFHFITYVIRHMVAVFYPGENRPTIVTFKPPYTRNERLQIVGELIVIALLQCAIYQLAGGQWHSFLWASPVALLFTSTFAMAYIWTNHYLHRLHEIHDPVSSSTSIVVHPMFDKLHSNFSCHTEHHLFPSINSDFYPFVSRLLSERYPQSYNRLPFGQAWKLLWKGEMYIRE